METMRAVLIASLVALVVSGCAAMSPQPSTPATTALQKVPDAEWCAGKYDPTRGTNFGPCVAPAK